MQHFRSDQPSSYLTPLPLFSDNALVDTKPVTFERVADTRTNNTYNPGSTQRGRRFASVNNSYPNFPATASTSTHNTYNQQLRSPLNPISRNARPSRASFSQTPASADFPSRSHSTMQNNASIAADPIVQGQFPGLFPMHPQLVATVIGPRSSLRKLFDAMAAGLSITPAQHVSAAAAFQVSLQPYQQVGAFPTNEQMDSLFKLPDFAQLACGLDKARDFTIAAQESAGTMILPPLSQLREIDCARKYLEVGNRHQSGQRFCFEIMVLTLNTNGQFLIHALAPPSRSHSTHSVLLFRHLRPDIQGNTLETWYASATARGIPAPRVQPAPLNPQPSVAGPSTQPQPPMPPIPLPAQATQTTHSWGNGNGVDPLVGVTDPNTVEGNLILRVAMRNTNQEIHRKLADLGSEAKYNSITKRISNALKAQARAELQPGEQFDPKYEALREEFDAERDRRLGRQSAQRGGSNGGVGKGKRRKTGSKTFVAGDESDMEEEFDEMDLEKEEDTDMEDDEEGGAGGGYSLRSSNCAPRANTSSQIQDEIDEDDVEDGLGGHDDGDDSDGSVYDGT